MPLMKSRRCEQGLTLVELIIAMAILAVAIMALVSSITSSGQIQQNTRERVIAYNAAREQIEKMRVYATAEIYSRYNNTEADDVNYPSGGWAGHPGPTFHVPRLAAPSVVPAKWWIHSTSALETWKATSVVPVPAGASTVQLDGFGNPIGNDGYGRITFPEVGGVLNESYVDAAMGMPRDLDRSGGVVNADVSGSYKILPVKVTVTWKGIGGKDMSIEVNTFITDK
jgi:prepilin-type N-terminal cleavage/methylation domain-containing protein